MTEESRPHRLSEIVKFFGARGWVPATSSNFSYRSDEGIVISISGRDKSEFSPNDLMVIDDQLSIVDGSKNKPSAETHIHLGIYELYGTDCVFHTHSSAATVLSMRAGAGNSISFAGYEVLKGLHGISDHEFELQIPVFANSQNMIEFKQKMMSALKERQGVYGFLIEGHGLYTWGSSLAETKRHIEVFEFLFECRIKELSIK